MTFQLIKLLRIKKFPFEELHQAALGINYKSKQINILKLQHDKKNEYDKLKNKIHTIDTFNYKNQKLYDNETIKVNKRTERFIPNIEKYTEDLLLERYDQEEVNSINRIWSVAYDNDNLTHPIFKESEKLSHDKNEILNKYQIHGKLKDMIQQYGIGPCYKIQTFVSHDITDHSATSFILTDRRNSLASAANNTIDDVYNKIDMIENIKSTHCKINNGVSIEELFPPFDFYKVWSWDKSFARWLSNMHQAVKPNCQDSIKYCRNVSDMYFITNNPLVAECGHSGGSMAVTVSHLKYVYNNGWIAYVKKIYDL